MSNNLVSALHCRKPYRRSLNPTYFAAAQPGQAGNEQFFYFTNLVRATNSTVD
jgi:hypothetical protein